MTISFNVSPSLKRAIKAPFRILGVDLVGSRPYPLEFLSSLGIRTVLDIGAYHGAFAQEIRVQLPDAMIHSFEPLPDAYTELVKVMEHDAKFSAWNTAVGEEDRPAIMGRNAMTPSSSLLKPDQMKQYFPDSSVIEEITVPMITLDTWVDEMLHGKELECEILLKADVQGYETHVIAGARRTMSKVKACILEVSFVPFYSGQPLFHDVYELMRQYGFDLHGMIDPIFDPITKSQLQSNAIFCKAE